MSAVDRLAFWLRPATYTLPERLLALEPGLSRALAEQLLGCQRLTARLSLRILGQAGLATGGLPAESPAFALARLLPGDIMRIAHACGALLHHVAIRSIVLREERQRLREVLGVQAHELAIKRAPFLRLPTRTAPPNELLDAVRRDGLACLRARFMDEPPGLAGRLALKLPPESGFDRPDPALAQDVGRRVVRRVLLEGDPAWRAFSS